VQRQRAVAYSPLGPMGATCALYGQPKYTLPRQQAAMKIRLIYCANTLCSVLHSRCEKPILGPRIFITLFLSLSPAPLWYLTSVHLGYTMVPRYITLV